MRACPFCSGDEIELFTTVYEQDDVQTGLMAYYQCEHCGAQGSHFLEKYEDDDARGNALAAWNGEHR